MYAYDEDYLPDAKEHLGTMLDFAVNTCGMDLRAFYNRFTGCSISRMFGIGHPMFVAGMSGRDMAERVLTSTGYTGAIPDYRFNGYTPEFWAGWALAQFQWYSGADFLAIDQNGLPIEKVVSLYNPLHEADISKFLDIAGKLFHAPEFNLKAMRKAAGLTQQDLAERAGVSLRMIRAYEQGTQPIERAEHGAVERIMGVLGV